MPACSADAMSPGIQTEMRLLLMSLLTGAGLMALYDVLRIFRLLIPHGFLWIGVEDFLYWIISGFTTFYLLYRENDGALRFCAVAGVLLSMIVYDRIFSINFLNLLKKAGRWIRIKVRRSR